MKKIRRKRKYFLILNVIFIDSERCASDKKFGIFDVTVKIKQNFQI